MTLRTWQCPRASLYVTDRSFQLVGVVGVGAGEVISTWPAPQAKVAFYEPCCRLTAGQKACGEHTAEQCALLQCRKPCCLCALTVSTG